MWTHRKCPSPRDTGDLSHQACHSGHWQLMSQTSSPRKMGQSCHQAGLLGEWGLIIIPPNSEEVGGNNVMKPISRDDGRLISQRPPPRKMRDSCHKAHCQDHVTKSFSWKMGDSCHKARFVERGDFCHKSPFLRKLGEPRHKAHSQDVGELMS